MSRMSRTDGARFYCPKKSSRKSPKQISLKYPSHNLPKTIFQKRLPPISFQKSPLKSPPEIAPRNCSKKLPKILQKDQNQGRRGNSRNSLTLLDLKGLKEKS